MDPGTLARVRLKFDEMMDCLCSAAGISYEDAMAAIAPHIENQDAFFLRVLSDSTRSIRPPGTDFAPAAFSTENLEKINTREKFLTMVGSMPEQAAPEIEGFFNHVMKEVLPSHRGALEKMAEQLPHNPGGRPSMRPSPEACLKICNKISDLHRNGLGKIKAQQRAADEWGLTLRMVQRIWAERNLNI